MNPPFRQQNRASILDTAAALLARQGVSKTSVQDIADAVGLSKAGLLHHFPSKDALHQAILQQADERASAVLAELTHLPPGVGRDRQVTEVIVDATSAHPGLVAYMLLPALRGEPPTVSGNEPELFITLLFGDTPGDITQERMVRVHAALAVLTVLSLSAPPELQTTAWRKTLVAASFDALGHSRPEASVDTSTHREA